MRKKKQPEEFPHGHEILVNDKNAEIFKIYTDKISAIKRGMEALSESLDETKTILWESVHKAYPEVKDYQCALKTCDKEATKIIIHYKRPTTEHI